MAEKNNEVVDCRYCNYCACDSPTDDKNVDCYGEDGGGYFSHHIQDPVKEAQDCEWFRYCDSFPKW